MEGSVVYGAVENSLLVTTLSRAEVSILSSRALTFYDFNSEE